MESEGIVFWWSLVSRDWTIWNTLLTNLRMRFSLRNRSKLIKTFGEAMYKLFLVSLQTHFKENSEIQESEYEGLDYKVLLIKNVRKPKETFIFAIYKRKWDILHLAFYRIDIKE